MQVFDQVLPSPTQSLNQRLCLCSTEGIIEKKERLQKKTSEPERIKIQKIGARREQQKYNTIKMKAIILSEILRPKRGRELLES